MKEGEGEQVDLMVSRVLARFGHVVQMRAVESLRSAGGMSGAEFWRVSDQNGIYCLRRWLREHPSEDRLQSIHRVLQFVHSRGLTEVAVPLPDVSGRTVVHEDGSLWELTRWMPGAADDTSSPSPARIASALKLLARFHMASALMSTEKPRPPVGLEKRRNQLRQLLDGGFSRLREAVRGTHSTVTSETIEAHSRHFIEAFPSLAPRVMGLLERSCQHSVFQQPCIRDVRHDHILFTGDIATGLVDFGALQEDHVACDISRLLGSLVRDDRAGWQFGLAAYEQVRPVTTADRQLIPVYDRSAVLLSAMNWLQWLYVDRRAFDLLRVQQRFDEIGSRLDTLVKVWHS